MLTPSAVCLEGHFPGHGKEIRAILEACDGSPKAVDKALDAVDAEIHGFGVEALRGSGWERYYLDIAFLYVNVGETYASTVGYEVELTRWVVGGWGDWVEAYERRGGSVL